MACHSEECAPAKQAGQPDQLLTERDLAARWQVSIKTLQNARVTGGSVRFLKIGRAVRYRLADIILHEEARVRASTSDRAGS